MPQQSKKELAIRERESQYLIQQNLLEKQEENKDKDDLRFCLDEAEIQKTTAGRKINRIVQKIENKFGKGRISDGESYNEIMKQYKEVEEKYEKNKEDCYKQFKVNE